MIWFGIEPLVPLDPERGLQLAGQSKLPLVSEFIVRRVVDANAISKLVDILGKMEVSEAMLKGMRDGLNGRRDLKAPEGWGRLYVKLESKEGEIARLAAQISQQFGVSSASDFLFKSAMDPKEVVDERRDAIRALAARQDDKLVPAIPTLLDDPSVRIEAVRAVAAFDRKEFGELLLKKYPGFTTAEKLEVVQTLASRSGYGWQLTQAIKKEDVPRRDVPSYVARQLRRAVAFKKYRELLKPDVLDKADLNRGRLLFQRSCMACHKLHGEGGQLGPDITGANRSSLDYLLDNILDPSGVIQDDYRMVMITTRDGRTFAGNVVSEDERQLKLRIVGQDIALVKSEIQSREVSPVSMMPEGILNTLKDAEVVDLFAYLQAMKPVK
jgi:putative heme-binding domain-containing protein